MADFGIAAASLLGWLVIVIGILIVIFNAPEEPE
jgi:hypothetical protein